MKYKPLGVWCFSWPSSVQLLGHVRLFATPWIAACQASLSITNSWSPPKSMSIESLMPSNHLILCRPLLLPPSIFSSIMVFSNESALRIRWPKYSALTDNPHTGVCLRLCLSKEPELSIKNCCHLVATSSKTTLKPVLKESYYSEGLWCFRGSVVSDSL